MRYIGCFFAWSLSGFFALWSYEAMSKYDNQLPVVFITSMGALGLFWIGAHSLIQEWKRETRDD